jgi:hypothetical protein
MIVNYGKADWAVDCLHFHRKGATRTSSDNGSREGR